MTQNVSDPDTSVNSEQFMLSKTSSEVLAEHYRSVSWAAEMLTRADGDTLHTTIHELRDVAAFFSGELALRGDQGLIQTDEPPLEGAGRILFDGIPTLVRRPR